MRLSIHHHYANIKKLVRWDKQLVVVQFCKSRSNLFCEFVANAMVTHVSASYTVF